MLDLNINLNDVETIRPTLVDGVYRCHVKSVEVVDKKNDPSKKNLHVVVATNVGGLSIKAQANGETEPDVNPGFTFQRYLPLQQSDNENASDFRIDLSRWQDACLKTDASNRGNLDPEQWINKELDVKVSAVESDQYGWGNEIHKVVATP